MTGRLDGKVALISGSTRGLGEAMAKGMAAESCKVAVSGRTVEDGKRVASEINDAGGEAEFIQLDLADEDSVARCVEQTVDRFGLLNVLINNAAPTEHITGAGHDMNGKLVNKADGAVAAISTANWRKVLTPGLDGVFWSMHYAIPKILEAGGGSIINISSTASLLGTGGLDAYTATKGAMNAMTRSVAVNYAPTIRCNCIVAGTYATAGLAPLLNVPEINQAVVETLLTEDVAQPSAIAGPVIFLASDESAYVTGQLLAVDGGMSIKMAMPKLPDGLLQQPDA